MNMTILSRWRGSLVALILLTVFLALSIMARSIFLSSFIEIENQTVARDIERVRDGINEILQQLETTNSDYAVWDEAYRFVQDGNQAFVETNLDDTIYQNLRLNLLGYFDQAGRPVYLTAYDYRHNQKIKSADDFAKYLAPGSKLLNHPNEKSALSGILSLPEGFMMVTSRPVLTSSNNGPAKGTMVIGRFFDGAEVGRLGQMTHLELVIRPAFAENLPIDYLAAKQTLLAGKSVHIRTDEAEQVYGYTLFRDILDEQAFIVRTQSPRYIFDQGAVAIKTFLLWSGVIFSIAAVVMIVSVRKPA